MCRQIDLFNTPVSERRMRHREMFNKGNIMINFDTRDLLVVRKKVKPSRKDGMYQKLVFKTKGPYIVLDKAALISYWLQRLNFCGGLGRLRIKVKESAARMEKHHPQW